MNKGKLPTETHAQEKYGHAIEKELRVRLRQQEAVAELSRSALSGRNIDELMHQAVCLVSKRLELEFAEVLELLPDQKALLLRAGIGWKKDLVGNIRINVGRRSQAGYTLMRKRPVVVKDLNTEKRFRPSQLLVEHGAVSGMTMVLRGSDGAFGVLGAHTRRNRAFTKEDVNFLQAVANILAQAIQRQQTLEALRESENQFRQLAENLEDGILWLTDAEEGRVLYVSPRYETLWQRSRESVYQNRESFLEVVHPEDRPKLRDALQRQVDGFYNQDYRIVQQGGSVRWIWARAFPIRDVRGRPYRVAGVAVDVTNRKRAEQALRESEQLYRTLIEQSSDPIYLLQGDRYIMVNQAWTRLFGYSAEEATSPEFDILRNVAREDRPLISERLERRRRGEKVPPIYEFQGLTRDGRVVHLEVNTSDITYRGRSAVQGIYRDITERKQAEEALRKSEKQFQDLFRGSPDAIFIVDLEGGILGANSAAGRLLSAEEATLVGQSVSDLFPKHRRVEYAKQFQALVAGDTDYLETTLWTRRRQEVPVELRGSHIEYWGKPALLLHVRDSSERKRLEEQLRHSQKMEAVGRLAGGLAHDFNNLLTAIIGYSEFVLGELPKEDAGRQDVEEIRKVAEKASALTAQLLAFSRKQELSPKSLNLNEVVNDLFNMLKRIIGEDIRVHVRLTDDLPPVWADAGQIQQALLNICVNARDAMPQGGELSLETHYVTRTLPEPSEGLDSHEFVQVRVADTGIGMDEATQQKIFEPFFTTKSVEKGTGLGLSVVYGIVKQHGGLIEVQSRLGEGTTFDIYFPARDGAELPTDVLVPGKKIRGEGQLVLLIEDDPMVRNVGVRILKSLGFDVVTASDGYEALKVFDGVREQVRFVITDVVMPRLSGIQTYRRLRQRRYDLPAIFVTGYDLKDEIEQLDKAEKAHVVLLQKPYTSESLSRKIGQLMNRCAPLEVDT